MRLYYILASLAVFTSTLSFADSITRCSSDNIEFQGSENYSTWPWSAVASINGNAIKTWLPEEIAPLNIDCIRQGGSDTPPWWLCQKTFAGNKILRATFWKFNSRAKAEIKLIENEVIVSVYEPLCSI